MGLNWAMTTIVDSTAIATYARFWHVFDSVRSGSSR